MGPASSSTSMPTSTSGLSVTSPWLDQPLIRSTASSSPPMSPLPNVYSIFSSKSAFPSLFSVFPIQSDHASESFPDSINHHSVSSLSPTEISASLTKTKTVEVSRTHLPSPSQKHSLSESTPFHLPLPPIQASTSITSAVSSSKKTFHRKKRSRVPETPDTQKIEQQFSICQETIEQLEKKQKNVFRNYQTDHHTVFKEMEKIKTLQSTRSPIAPMSRQIPSMTSLSSRDDEYFKLYLVTLECQIDFLNLKYLLSLSHNIEAISKQTNLQTDLVIYLKSMKAGKSTFEKISKRCLPHLKKAQSEFSSSTPKKSESTIYKSKELQKKASKRAIE